MKSVWIVCIFVVNLMAADAQMEAEQLGAQNNFSSAIEKAKKEHKMLFLLVVTNHCRWCKKMVYQTLSNTQVHTKLEETTVLLVLDKNDVMPYEFKSEIYPSTYFINPKTKKSVWANVGYVTQKVFLDDLSIAKDMMKLK